MIRRDLLGDDRLRTAAAADGPWLVHAQLWRPAAQDQLTTGDHETAAVLLHGTFDLVGGGTAWPARGARTSPLQGRPMAVFLPPRTVFQANGGRGEILLVAARQPAPSAPDTGRAGLTQKPLLPLAGSGKAFDPASGEWRPAETFPTAPESLPPRRMERFALGALWVERVLGADYKAATLVVDEVVLPAGAALAVGAIPGRPRHAELLLFVRTAGRATARAAGRELALAGDAVLQVPTPAGATDLEVAAGGADAYLLLAYAGKP